jgi:c-di-GMP-binding flagellar brake protein YcgR
MAKANRNKEEIRHIIEMLCGRRATLIFVTPDLRFESHFLHLAGNDVHVRVPAGKGDLLNALKGTDMKLRFHYKSSFLEATAKILGFGQHEGTRTLTLDLPREFYENDDRKAYRVERVGNVVATVSAQQNTPVDASLLDISITGAKLSAKGGGMNKALNKGDKIWLTIPIPNVVTVDNSAIVRHANENSFGVEYVPKLTPDVLEPLSKWVSKKQEEDRERRANRVAKGDNAENGPEAQKSHKKSDDGRVLVVTSDDEIERVLRKLLSEWMTVFHSEPSVSAMKMALAKMPHLVILHLSANYVEKKRLMKSLTAMVPSYVPILLLGTDIDSGALLELGSEWKATSITWANEKAVLVQRLVVGIVNKQFGQGESSVAPKVL